MRIETRFWLPLLADPIGVDPEKVADCRFHGDPDYLLQSADAHGVLPIVLHNLKTTDRIDFDTDVLERTENLLRDRMVRSMILRKQRKEIEQAFLSQGISALLLKGEDFADRLYPYSSMRHFTDLDLLLPQTHFERARTALADLGYKPASTSWQKHADQIYGEEAWLREKSTIPYGNVELHWNLVASPSLQRSVSVRWDDLTGDDSEDRYGIIEPDWNARLVITAVHAAVGHNFDRLTLLCDILQAVRCGFSSLETQKLKRQIVLTGTTYPLAVGLELTRKIFPCAEINTTFEKLGLRRPRLATRLLVDRWFLLGEETRLRTLRRKIFRASLKRAG